MKKILSPRKAGNAAVALFGCAAFCAALAGETEPAVHRPAILESAENEAKIEALLRQMTLPEKLGQLTQFSNGVATGPDNVRIDQSELAAKGGLGSVLNVAGARITNDLQRSAVERSRLKIPILFGLDLIHGYRTIYPIPLGLSSSWDPALIERCARLAAIEGSADGLRWTFSPMVDIARDARWGRITEGSGEDPYLASIMAAAWVRGYQGRDLSDPASIVACAKHFAAYGAAVGGRDYDAVDMPERLLREIYLPPFEAARNAGVGTFMSAFNTLNGIPASAHYHLITDILKKEWGFRGFVVSDWIAVEELIAHGIALDDAEAARKALMAGVDMDMCSNLYAQAIPGLIESGRVEIGTVDEAVRRILRVKFALGLFENPYTDESLSERVLLSAPHIEEARKAAEASFVLLRNEPVANQPILPLNADRTVALIGDLADNQKDMLGSWVLREHPKDVVTLRQALSERLGEKLTFVRGVSPTVESESGFGEALEAARHADVVIMALGEGGKMAGEAESRSTLNLPGKQLDLLRAVVETGKPVVLVLFSGRPLALPWESDNVPAILEAWYPGVQAGPALVRTLYGETNPSGKITASFPRSVGQMPLYYNALNTGRPRLGKPPGKGYITGYRDEWNTALYPFGWGLSYTTFDYGPTQLSVEKTSVPALTDGTRLTVTALVRNTGQRVGDEIVQLYIQQRGTSVARPVRELKGFEKITLAPGKSRTVQFEIGREELAFWNADLKKVIEPSELTVWIAPNSVAGQPVTIMVEP